MRRLIEDLIDEDEFIRDFIDCWYNGYNNEIQSNTYNLSYDCGQRIQIQDPQFADTSSYIEIEITDTIEGDSWTILAMVSNYGDPSPTFIEDEDEKNFIMNKFNQIVDQIDDD